ncbi:aminotransferase-like domain-containing protein [Crossiella cryophila]|uniref:DNA-binding transcriptional MocR family regulator n=1 Tax=Crossiella cryophila TaxID=43355 RepID=A0A7W7C958_9PSEU|nr:PLP-dependent aminotransferase family protein [Crossiella cryophila]MBB4676828.1 DNA-binding transcriptional MocR family regulator [Crossiella cryophila]
MDRFADPAELVRLLGDWTGRSGPRYQRLAAAISDLVAESTLPRGARLPAERGLAAALAVSRATVVAAYDRLREQGVLHSRRGSGTTVSPHTTARIRPDGRVRGGRSGPMLDLLVDRPGQTISLAQAIEPAVPELAVALRELVDTDLPALLADGGYHPRGLPALREAIATHLTGLGLPSTAAEIVVTTGAHQAIALVAGLYLDRGATVLVEAPGWPGSVDILRAGGATVVGVPIDEDGVRPDLLAAAAARHRPDLLYLMPTFHNPTGVLTSAGRRARITELAREHGFAVLEDNAYVTAGHGDPLPPPVAAFAHPSVEVLSVGSLAKPVWAGLRIGWVRGPRGIIDRLARAKVLADMGSPLLDQALAARLLPRLPEIAKARAVILRQRLRHLGGLVRTRLPEWRWREPRAGSALWIALPGVDAAVFAQVALRHGVEVVPGAAMDPDGGHEEYIRLPFTFPEPVLDELVDRLERAWTELRRHGPADGGTRPVV